MGFGLLMLGYFTENVVAVNSMFSPAAFLGAILVSVALFRLAPYGKKFLIAFFLSLAVLPVSLYYAVFGFVRGGLIPTGAVLSYEVFAVVEWVQFGLNTLLTLLVLAALADLAKELELSSLYVDSWRNLMVFLVYSVFSLVVHMPLPVVVEHTLAFHLPEVILRFAVVFLNLWLFFGALRRIAPEGEREETTLPPLS